MATKYTNSKKSTDIDGILADHGEELKNQKSITFFFTIIVAATLVATLVGMVGVYVTVLILDRENIKSNDEKVENLSKDVAELKTDFQVLRAKNSYLK